MVEERKYFDSGNSLFLQPIV
ncbi:hypothetical protein EYZ11_013103 [Aspergillus tanneri]|uniref:Uncharacterized protein n=1 Tax=Aspergillus tanneri TaxID=1220188 RepID=A0A4S3J3Y1_9EURO|nr:hypothetical protein EYZ11_013103 [Aspergillus tanneri]